MPLDPPIRYKMVNRSQPGPDLMWTIHRPDLGMVGSGYIWNVLVQNVTEYRRANGIPIGPDFEVELEQALREAYKSICPGCFSTDDPREPVEPRALSLRDVMAGSQVMVSFLGSGREIVSEAEAARRTAICVGCRYNVQFSKACSGGLCGPLLELVKRIVPNGMTNNPALNSCHFCGCLLQAAIWLPQPIQWAPLSDHVKALFLNHAPVACWKLPDLVPANPGPAR